MNTPEIVVMPDPAELAREAVQRFRAISGSALAQRGQFNVVLSGGSTPIGLYSLLAQEPYQEAVDWSRTFVYFGDERCVPPDHPDSNFRMARQTLLDAVGIPQANVFRMAGELAPEEGAAIYEAILRQDFHLRGYGRPRFDLVLLGMGDDGHTASLFSGMQAVQEHRRLVVPTEVPAHVRPAVLRLTLTCPVLNAAANVLFMVTGAGKAAAVHRALAEEGSGYDLPSRQIRPKNGALTWLLDKAAASELP